MSGLCEQAHAALKWPQQECTQCSSVHYNMSVVMASRNDEHMLLVLVLMHVWTAGLTGEKDCAQRDVQRNRTLAPLGLVMAARATASVSVPRVWMHLPVRTATLTLRGQHPPAYRGRAATRSVVHRLTQGQAHPKAVTIHHKSRQSRQRPHGAGKTPNQLCAWHTVCSCSPRRTFLLLPACNHCTIFSLGRSITAKSDARTPRTSRY